MAVNNNFEDYNTEYDNYLQAQQDVVTHFTIDDAQKANWAIGVIKKEKELLKVFEEVALVEIEKLKASIENEKRKCQVRTGFLESSLMDFMETAPSKETKTQFSLALPAGKIVCKKPALEFVSKNDKPINTDPDVIKYCEETDAEELVKTEKKVNWSILKKKLIINDDGQVVNGETGEVLDCIQTVLTPMKIDIK